MKRTLLIVLKDIRDQFDVYAAIASAAILGFIVLVQGQNEPRVMGAILSVLALIAFSIRRDRKLRHGKPKTLIEAEQVEAYKKLIKEVRRHRPDKAVLIQYSCSTAFELVRELSRRNAEIKIYIQNEETPKELGIFHQAERIESKRRAFRVELAPYFNPQKLSVIKYRTPASVAAVRIDDRVIFMGWYLYLAPTEQDAKPDDKAAVYAHNVAGIIAYKGSTDYDALNATFEKLLLTFTGDNVEPVNFGSPTSVEK